MNQVSVIALLIASSSTASASLKARPAYRRYTSSREGRDTVTEATLTPSASRAASTAGTARAPLSVRARSARGSTATS